MSGLVGSRPAGPWRIALTVPEALAEVFAEAIGAHADAVSTFEIEEHGAWLVEAVAQQAPDRADLAARVAVLARAVGLAEPDLVIEELPPLDWLTRSYRSFPPLRIGRYFVYGSHHEGGVPPGAVGLLIDAATAFGSGEHATTAGCLTALDRLARRGRPTRVLDMGCGSGILALAAAGTWHVPVHAVDIDPEAVRVTRLNARRNRLQPFVRAEAGDGYHTALVRRGGRYPLIVSNILARPLARMAPLLRRHLAPGGTAILSGLLARHERHVLAAHSAQGLRLAGRIAIGEWNTLVLKG